VVGLVVVVVGVVVGVVAADELDDDPDVVGVAVVGVVVLAEDPEGGVVTLVTADECAVVSEATRRPRPTALAAAVIPTAVVVRRTRDMARSRARAGCSGRWLSMRGCRAMSRPFVRRARDPCDRRPTHSPL
jgi:hypothetical protein